MHFFFFYCQSWKPVFIVLTGANWLQNMDSILFDGLLHHCLSQILFYIVLHFWFVYLSFCLFVVMFFPDVCAGCKDSVELKREGRESLRVRGNTGNGGRVCVYACTCMSFQQITILVLPITWSQWTGCFSNHTHYFLACVCFGPVNHCLRSVTNPDYTYFICFEKHPVLSLCSINPLLATF